MARTKRGRRSYGAGEWGRNRVRVFPDPKTGLFQLEWRENGRRLTRSLGHREWVRAKRQGQREWNHGKKSRKFIQGCTICAFCPWIASTPAVQKRRGNRLNSRESFSVYDPPSLQSPPSPAGRCLPDLRRPATDITVPIHEDAPRQHRSLTVGVVRAARVVEKIVGVPHFASGAEDLIRARILSASSALSSWGVSQTM